MESRVSFNFSCHVHVSINQKFTLVRFTVPIIFTKHLSRYIHVIIVLHCIQTSLLLRSQVCMFETCIWPQRPIKLYIANDIHHLLHHYASVPVNNNLKLRLVLSCARKILTANVLHNSALASTSGYCLWELKHNSKLDY